jgi:hypothetical protein
MDSKDTIRGLIAVAASVSVLVISTRIGERTVAGYRVAEPLAVLASTTTVLLLEYLLFSFPRQFRRGRLWLDGRAVFEGVWIQNVKRVEPRGAEASERNRFAIFSTRYDDQSKDYRIEGRAYDAEGVEYARWKSKEQVHFSHDGRSLSYLWEGDVTGDSAEAPDHLARTGFSKLDLTSDDGGTGRVDHVSMHITLIFDFMRVTAEALNGWQGGARPERLYNPDERDRFAIAYARRLREKERPPSP